MLSRVLRTIREQDLVIKGDRLLVAVSGGPDSTALLHGLCKVASRLGVTLTAACVDHGLRSDSADEAREVQRRSQGLHIPCEILRVDVNRGRKAHVSIQEAARNARLAALESAAVRLGCPKVALGHTADDQAETVLFRILRGTGIAGLAGIPYRRGVFIRPLLDVRRAEILAFLSKRKVAFFSDPSNANRRYSRSRIRHDVLPLLAKENPRVVEALLALAHEARSERGSDWQKDLPSALYLPRRTRRTVDRWLREGHGTRTLTVRAGELAVGYGKVSWLPRKADETARDWVAPAEDKLEDRLVVGPGRYRIAASPASGLEVTAGCTGPWPSGNRACFDASKLAWPLRLRTFRPGDRMLPRGGRGSRKLSDLLIDAKIPRQDRAVLPVLCDALGVILYVPGLRPSHIGRPDGDTQEWFEVQVLR